MMGIIAINESPPEDAPPAAWANAVPIIGFSERKFLISQGFSCDCSPQF